MDRGSIKHELLEFLQYTQDAQSEGFQITDNDNFVDGFLSQRSPAAGADPRPISPCPHPTGARHTLKNGEVKCLVCEELLIINDKPMVY